MDTPPEHLCRLMQALATPEFSTTIYRAPSRSPGSLPSLPRLRLELLMPQVTSELEQTILMGHLKGVLGGSDILVGHKNLYGQQDALTCEVNSPNAVRFISHLCTPFIFLSQDRAILKTNAALETWQSVLDDLM